MTNILNLAGKWDRLLDGRLIDTVTVPGSYPPVGEVTLERTFPFESNAGSGRQFLCTEGVLATADFTLNGQPIGTAGPWSRYRFEIPSGLLQAENVVSARVRDISEFYGPTPGRRFDAGLVREIFLESRPMAFIEEVVFRYDLAEDHSAASCTVTVEINGVDAAPIEISLMDRENGRIVASITLECGQTARFDVPWPNLWSPEMPRLYVLSAVILGEPGDGWTENVGFRRIEVRGRDFYLNGKRLLLKGVCRHEFMAASGYSPSDAEVRRDIALIRHSGFNHVRLVHSPQAGCVSRIAADVGLLVTEEPGTCFHDLGDERIVQPALECLTRMVRRDRNVPSIFAWYLYNECNPNSDYAVRAAKVCRDLDPNALIAFADCSGQDDNVKAMVRDANLSFYGINHYSFSPRDYVNKMTTFTDLPLVITEWGGWLAQGNPRVRKDLCNAFVKHSREDQAVRIAGFSFWAWADYEEYSRDEPATIEGWTVEGLIDKLGRPKEDLLALTQTCFEMDHPPPVSVPAIEILSPGPERSGEWETVALESVDGDQSILENRVEKIRNRFVERPPDLGRIMTAGLPFDCRNRGSDGQPLLIGPGREELLIPVGRTVKSIAILGHVAIQGGYPSSTIWSVHHRDAESQSVLGTTASEYELVFDDGIVTIPLRHGFEILRANNICRWWKTAPRTSQTKPAVEVVVHPTYEILRLDLWEQEWAMPRTLKCICWRLTDKDSIQAMYAVTVQC